MTTDREFSDGELVPGTRYQVESQIGAGGMGSVYVVEHVELGKRFVLKALLRELARRKDLVARLRQEWRALARLNHANIINVTDAGTSDTGVPFYVMEFLDGETLAVRLKKRRRLPLAEALEIAAGVLDGLAAAHEIGIVHRDVKPPNIFLVGATGVKLLDFGIAKIADSSAEVITARGVAIGTPRFMSPEQARGDAVDGRADLYASGLILYEMVSGAGPFDDAKDANELLLAHIGKEAPRLSWAAPGVPPEVDAVVARLLAKQPADRPPSARQVARELREIARRAPAVAPAPSVGVPRSDSTEASISAVPTNPLPAAAREQTRVPTGEATAVDPISSGTTELATPRIEIPAAPARVDVTVPGVGLLPGDTLHSSAPSEASARPVASDRSRTLRIDEYVPPAPEVETHTALPLPPGGETPPPVESGDASPREPPRAGVPAWIPLSLTGVVVATVVALGTWVLIGGGSSSETSSAGSSPTAEPVAAPTAAPAPTPASSAAAPQEPESAPAQEPEPARAPEPAPAPAPMPSASTEAPKPAAAAPTRRDAPPKAAPAPLEPAPVSSPKPVAKPSPAPSPAPAPAPATKPKLTLPGSGL